MLNRIIVIVNMVVHISVFGYFLKLLYIDKYYTIKKIILKRINL